MRHRHRHIAAAFLVALSLAGSTALAATTGEARELLDKATARYAKGGFSTGVQVQIDVSQLGAGVPGANMAINGTMTYRDTTHMRSNMNMTMSGMQGMGPIEMKMNIVMDGEIAWIEADMAMLGGQMVMKMPLDQMDAAAGANPMLQQMDSFNMMGKMNSLGDSVDFEIVSRADGVVRLRGILTEEALPDLDLPAQTAAMLAGQAIEIDIDEKESWPMAFRFGGEQPFMTATYTDTVFMDPSSMSDEDFSYTPPPGVQVIDAQQLQMMQGGPQ